MTENEVVNLIGKLTQDQSLYLFKRLIVEALTEEQLFAALEETLTKNQKEELGESWFNIDREGH